MIIRVEVKNAILGDHIFWQGPATDIAAIRNVPARITAELVAKDGVSRTTGMWVVSVLIEEPPA